MRAVSGRGARHEASDVGEDRGAAFVGVEEAVHEIVVGAEVELGDAVDRRIRPA